MKQFMAHFQKTPARPIKVHALSLGIHSSFSRVCALGPTHYDKFKADKRRTGPPGRTTQNLKLLPTTSALPSSNQQIDAVSTTANYDS